MPSLQLTSTEQQITESVIVVKTPSLSTLIRKRAHQQFQSNSTTRPSQNSENRKIHQSAQSGKESRTLSQRSPVVSRVSTIDASPQQSSEGKRTLRNKASMSFKRPISSKSPPRSKSLNRTTYESLGNATGTAHVPSTTSQQSPAAFKKRDAIIASPVMSAMLQSHRMQRIKAQEEAVDRRATLRYGDSANHSIIDGSGIKVKSGALKVGSVNSPASSATKVLRVKPQMESNSAPKLMFAATAGKSPILKGSHPVQSHRNNGRTQSRGLVSTKT